MVAYTVRPSQEETVPISDMDAVDWRWKWTLEISAIVRCGKNAYGNDTVPISVCRGGDAVPSAVALGL